MGSTPHGVVARRTCPSSVPSLRGRATHAPADSRVRTERYCGQLHPCLGRRPGVAKVGSRMVRAGGAVEQEAAGASEKVLVLFPEQGPAAFCVADPRRQGGGQGSTALCGAGSRSALRRSCGSLAWVCGAVIRRDHVAHAVSLGNLDIISTSSLSGRHLPSCHATVYGSFGRIS